MMKALLPPRSAGIAGPVRARPDVKYAVPAENHAVTRLVVRSTTIAPPSFVPYGSPWSITTARLRPGSIATSAGAKNSKPSGSNAEYSGILAISVSEDKRTTERLGKIPGKPSGIVGSPGGNPWFTTTTRSWATSRATPYGLEPKPSESVFTHGHGA